MAVRLPDFRRLRVYAIDPGLALRHETVGLNELILNIPWETNPGIPGAADTNRMIGPVGNYLEVVDFDPAIERLPIHRLI